MPSELIFVLLLMLANAYPDETLRRYGAADKTWHLITLNGTNYDGDATITFPERNRIVGKAPCNSYTSTNTTPYPWIEIGPIVATRRACPDLAAETAFFAALRTAKIAIVEEGSLTLSTEDTVTLVFESRD